MNADFTALDQLRLHHPAWKLLRSDHAPLLISFLHQSFIAPNVRVIAQSALVAALDDTLYALHSHYQATLFPRSALDYLNDWAAADKAWLRKFYLSGDDDPYFDLTPASEKAIAWVMALSERQFVGTESRLLTLFDLLQQINSGTETDPQKRVRELRKKRDAIHDEIDRVLSGKLDVLDDSAVRERFAQFQQTARELLADFREVEHNFRQLDRHVRERIALWQGNKGELLAQIIGQRDAIADSDQGKSFRAFWEFLMSSARQEELTQLLDYALALPSVAALNPDMRTRRVHYDWLEAGEHTQRTVAQLSQQLRRFLDDQAWLENRRIMDILQKIEAHAVHLRDTPPSGEWMNIAEASAAIELAFERPLFTPALKPVINALVDLSDVGEDIDTSALYDQIVVDKSRLAQHIRQALQAHNQIGLYHLIEAHPLQQGLAELIAYLQLGCETFQTVVDESINENIAWQTVNEHGEVFEKNARLPRIIFIRS